MRRSLFETWMFSVVFWILCSWLPCLADWQVSCSRYMVQLQQNICHQNDCEHEWQSTFSSRRTWGSENNFLRRDEYRRPDSQVLCLTALGIYQAGHLEFNSSSDRQPVKLTQYRCDVLRVTQGHWKRHHWTDHTQLTSSRVIWRWILLWPWNMG